MVDGEPFSTAKAKALILAIIDTGSVVLGTHVRRDSMPKHNVTAVDITNILRAGTLTGPESENGEWRYRVSTHRIVVVVAFRSETELRVVTVWRT